MVHNIVWPVAQLAQLVVIVISLFSCQLTYITCQSNRDYMTKEVVVKSVSGIVDLRFLQSPGKAFSAAALTEWLSEHH